MTVTTNRTKTGIQPNTTPAGLSAGPALVAALGDSITAYSVTGGVNTNFLSYQPHGFLTWAMGFSMGSLWCPLVGTPNNATPLLNYNRGVSGETAEQAAARITEIDALPTKPRFCSVLAGTNNLVLNLSQTSASIAATVTGICDALLARGITPVLCTLLPRGSGTSGGWSTLTSGQITTARGRLMDVNRRLRTYAANTTGVILADLFYSILDYSSATSDPVASLTGASSATPDYIHPNVPGSQAVGLAWWNAVSKSINAAVVQAAGLGDAWDGTNNPFGSMWDSSYNTNGGTAGTGAAAVSAWGATTAYTVNAVVTSGGNLYQCVVAGTSGTVAPVHTTGQALDGTVLWQYRAASGVAGVPVSWTVVRSTGSACTAAVATSARSDGQTGNEMTISLNASTDAIAKFQSYPTATSGALPNANFSANDAIYCVFDVVVDCGSALAYGVPDIQLRTTASAYAGTYVLNATAPNAGVATHCTGKFTAQFRTPILDTGATNIQTVGGVVALDGARTGGSGSVLFARRNQQIRKYDKTAPGAITW
jgi:lysophospholipase L1-like esterase